MLNIKRGWFRKVFKKPKLRGGSPRRRQTPLNLVKPQDNPIIMPIKTNGWEAWQVFNPGVIGLDDKVHFLYRAIGEDGLSRLGYAVSHDGFKINQRLDYPVYEHCYDTCATRYSYYSFASGGSFGGCEDPRLVRVDNEDVIYVTYTACDNGLRVALTSIKVDDLLARRWKWKKPMLISKPGEVHKNWVIFPEKINGKYAILHSINPNVEIAYTDSLEFEQDECIESKHVDGGKAGNTAWHFYVRGAGPPPIKTKHGWLLFYHALGKKDPGKYKLGAMLLNLTDPTKILVRSDEPILEPTEDYEHNGYKGGIVYAVGAVVKEGKLLVYYGSADNYICVATADFDKFVNALYEHKKPKLIRSLLKKLH